MGKNTFKLNPIAYSLILACSIASAPAFTQEQADTTKDANKEKELEVIEVTGVRNSILQSLNDKRFADSIVDTISAEDIGQLPDENIAEALQRVTGVQMSRAEDGEGSSIQIRGLSDNNIEINGVTVAGSSGTRGINFQDIPSELFSAIEVQKAPTADNIEGSLGGRINLKTRRPLNNKKNFLGSVTAKAKYAEIAEDVDPDVNAFVLKNWRNTGVGDVGLIVNLASKKVTSVVQKVGGGTFDAAPGVWGLRTGLFAPNRGSNNPNNINANNRNTFHPENGAGIWGYETNIDVNGDGTADENDVYYIPTKFGFASGVSSDQRDSINATLHWRPTDTLNFYFDSTLTQNEQSSSGATYGINLGGRSAVLSSPDNVFTNIGQSALVGGGDVFYMSSGRLSNATTRIGASPNINETERDSALYRISGDWAASDSLSLSFELSTSDGSAATIQQAALIAGIDYNGNGQLTGSDAAQLVDFDFNDSIVGNATLYESPHPAPVYGVTEVQTTLVPIDPTDLSYERLNYFQFNRVANNSENTADSFRLDGEWELENNFIQSVEFGVRLAQRTYARIGYQGPNQGNGPSTLWQEGDDLRQRVNVQAIRVNPDSNPNENLRASSEFLQSCLSTAGSSNFFGNYETNLPRQWDTTTGCDGFALSAAFGMIDIRAPREDNPDVGIYEILAQRFNVEEDTSALYLSANYETEVAGMPLMGNFGARYVQTDTISSGFSPLDRTPVSFEGGSNELLPSLNANLIVREDMVVRLGLSRTLGRPSLGSIAPSLRLFRSDETEGFAGTGESGNPDLKPLHSNNLDLSFEWYFDKESLLSIAYYNKNIDSRFERSNERVPVDVNGELFAIARIGNGEGTEIQGYELSLQHAFNYAPGLLSHTGAGVNYTHTEEDTDAVDSDGDPVGRRGLSEDSYNLNVFYDDKKLSLRLAYNWRGDFVNRERVSLGFNNPYQLPEIEKARGQLDFSANYKINRNIRVNFSAVNLNESKSIRYLKYEPLLNYLGEPGRRFTLGVTYQF